MGLSKDTVAFKVKIKALEQSCDLKNAITTALEYLNFVVQPFNKPAAETVREVIGDFVYPIIKRGKEFIETGQGTAANFVAPFDETVFAFFIGGEGNGRESGDDGDCGADAGRVLVAL